MGFVHGIIEYEALVPNDFLSWSGGMNVIEDDWLLENFVAKIPRGVEVFCVFDCCHSGSMLDLPYTLDTASDTFKLESGNAPKFKRYCQNDVKIVQLSGCLDHQTSKELTWHEGGEMKRGGLLTMSFMKQIEKNDGATLLDLAENLKQAGASRTQEPKISCSY